MHVILLTHEREASRPTNTGSIALKRFPEHCQRVMWSRVTPSSLLLDKLAEPGTALLFPQAEFTPADPVHGLQGGPLKTAKLDEGQVQDSNNKVSNISEEPRGSHPHYGDLCTNDVTSLPKTLVILDATWQEARKMLRQSPYLKAANTYSLTNTPESQFTLRRNQVEGGLCTLECIIELFKQADMHDEAQVLISELTDFCH
ncbi:DTW domain-containing protein [Shewanella sp. 125m-7]